MPDGAPVAVRHEGARAGRERGHQAARRRERAVADERPAAGVPEGYTGNVVLWAWPSATAGELVGRPLWHAAEVVSRAVARVDGGYFRSFVDFACSGAVEEEGLVPTADAAEKVLSPDVEVDSLLHVAFHDLDFGAGRPFFFMPGYLPDEGSVFIVRSFSGDGSVSAYVPLFSRAMEGFKKCCYSLATADARL